MNKLDKDYQDLLKDIMTNGVEKGDRTGTGTISVFGRQIRHKMSEGFPLLTTKKMAIKTMMTELKWFLKGDTNIKYLVDNNCHIWDGDAIKKWMSSGKSYKFRRNVYIEPKFEILSVDEVNVEDFPYINSAGYYGFEKDGIEELWVDFSKLDKSKSIQKFISDGFINKIKTDDEFAEEWGELGPIYGAQWRDWKTEVAIQTTLKIDDGDDIEPLYVKGTRYIDQIENLINDLKNNPDSRRLMVSAWNVGEISKMVLPPCHYGFQVYTRELSYKERYDIWFTNNYETGMERNYDNRPNFDDEYYTPTPTRELSLMWNQRSVDTFLGLPFNIASYATLLLLLCEEVGMVPGDLVGNLGDTHLYSNHIQQANEQCGRISYNLPTIKLSNVDVLNGEFDYEIIGYESHPSIKAPLSN